MFVDAGHLLQNKGETTHQNVLRDRIETQFLPEFGASVD